MDPFSCDPVAADAGCARGGCAALSLADLDARLSDFAVEHIWDASGSLCDFGCAAFGSHQLLRMPIGCRLGTRSASWMLRHTPNKCQGTLSVPVPCFNGLHAHWMTCAAWALHD